MNKAQLASIAIIASLVIAACSSDHRSSRQAGDAIAGHWALGSSGKCVVSDDNSQAIVHIKDGTWHLRTWREDVKDVKIVNSFKYEFIDADSVLVLYEYLDMSKIPEVSYLKFNLIYDDYGSYLESERAYLAGVDKVIPVDELGTNISDLSILTLKNV